MTTNQYIVCISIYVYTHIYTYISYVLYIYIPIYITPWKFLMTTHIQFCFFSMGPSTASGYKYQADTMPSFYEAAESMVVEAGFNNRDVLWPWDWGWARDLPSPDLHGTAKRLRVGTDVGDSFPGMTFCKDVGLLLGGIVDGGFQVVVAFVLREKITEIQWVVVLEFSWLMPQWCEIAMLGVLKSFFPGIH